MTMTRRAAVTPFLLLSSLVLGACDKSTPPAAVAESPVPVAADEPNTEPDPTPEAEPVEAKPAKPVEPTLAAAGVGAELSDPKPDDAKEAPAADEAEKTAADDEATPPSFKVLILGDSLIATGFGALLEKRLDAHPQVTAYRKGKSASGLARPDFFDWMAESKRQVELRKPDLVVAVMGGNDGQDLTRRKKSEGRRVPWKHEDWPATYRERMDSFLEQVSAPEREILWLGLPTMGLRSLEKKLVLIRSVQKEAVDDYENATYVDTAPFVSDEKGGMLTHAEVGAKKKRRAIRADDKIHFTMAGSEYFADAMYPKVLEALEIEHVDAPAE